MLTRDNRYVASLVARELELNDYFAEVLPHEKAKKVKKVKKKFTTCMQQTVNDAPALSQADKGIAIGAGSMLRSKQLIMYWLKTIRWMLLNIIRLPKSTYSKMYQNLIWVTRYNAFAILLAAALWLWGFTEPCYGCSSHEFEYRNSSFKRKNFEDEIR